MKNTKEKKGISLIVLVITIVVTTILAGVVIVGLKDNNPVLKANESLFKTDIAEFRSELSVSYVSEKAENRKFKSDTVNLAAEEMKAYMESMKPLYYEKLAVVKGKLVYIGENELEIKWAEEIGLFAENGVIKGDGNEEKPKEPEGGGEEIPGQIPDDELFSDKHFTIEGNKIEIRGNVLTFPIAKYGENIAAGTVVRGTDDNYYITIEGSYIKDSERKTFQYARCQKLNVGRLVVVGKTKDIKKGDIKKVGAFYYAYRPYYQSFTDPKNWLKLLK